MNTTVEEAFIDPHIQEVLTAEFLLGCVRSGDYVDPRDVLAHLQPSKARDFVMNTLHEAHIR